MLDLGLKAKIFGLGLGVEGHGLDLAALGLGLDLGFAIQELGLSLKIETRPCCGLGF